MMTPKYIDCDITHSNGIINRGIINTAYILYVEKFDNITLFHMRNGKGIFVKCPYDTMLTEMKKGWNASYDFITLPMED